jgi:hypothetical protein
MLSNPPGHNLPALILEAFMRRTIVLALVAGSAAVASKAAGQACMASPAREMQVALAGNLGFLENANFYGGSLGYNLIGPLAVNGSVGVTKPETGDDNGFTVGANFGYELSSTGGLSACPIAGVSYSNFVGGLFADDVNTWIIPLGLGLGTSLPLGTGTSNRMILSAFPHFQYISTRLDAGDPRESDQEFGLNLNVGLHNAQLFGGAGVGFTTIEGSDPTFSLNFGLLLGGRPATARRASSTR